MSLWTPLTVFVTKRPHTLMSVQVDMLAWGSGPDRPGREVQRSRCDLGRKWENHKRKREKVMAIVREMCQSSFLGNSLAWSSQVLFIYFLKERTRWRDIDDAVRHHWAACEFLEDGEWKGLFILPLLPESPHDSLDEVRCLFSVLSYHRTLDLPCCNTDPTVLLEFSASAQLKVSGNFRWMVGAFPCIGRCLAAPTSAH